VLFEQAWHGSSTNRLYRPPGYKHLLAAALSMPVAFLRSCYHLFTPAKFRVHRLFGMVYLAQFVVAFVLETMGLHEPILFVTMPITGWIQAIIACLTFTFLPRANEKEQGYYHQTKAMSYDFIVENIYFSGLLMFQSCYLSFESMRSNPLFLPIEVLCVFFPYLTVRDFFPKSSFRNTTNSTANKWARNYAKFVKVFYCIAKHFSGYYVNYLCFLGLLGKDVVNDWSLVRKLFLLGGWGTTIAMFLQTLKFKRYISPNAAMILYAGAFPFFYACYASMFVIALEHGWLTALTIIGLAMNFRPRREQIAWQTFMCVLCLALRYDIVQLSAIKSALHIEL